MRTSVSVSEISRRCLSSHLSVLSEGDTDIWIILERKYVGEKGH